jgi:hypothetical protein
LRPHRGLEQPGRHARAAHLPWFVDAGQERGLVRVGLDAVEELPLSLPEARDVWLELERGEVEPLEVRLELDETLGVGEGAGRSRTLSTTLKMSMTPRRWP